MLNPFDSQNQVNRRAFLGSSATCMGGLALSQLMQQAVEAGSTSGEGLPNKTLFTPQAKNMICLFQHGGPSQMDLFDYKPALNKWHGKPYPGGDLEVHFDKQAGNVLGAPYQFASHGECGMELSELLPHTAKIVDDITLIRSMQTESVDHESALRLIHSGKFLAGMPVMGSWVVYALGSGNENLPAYVVLTDPGGLPVDGERNWSSEWLPAIYQGTPFRSGPSVVSNLNTPQGIPFDARVHQLDLLKQLNGRHLQQDPYNTELSARIQNFETAARMQLAVPEVLDISQETKETHELYGLNNPETAEYGKRCLLARRLIERGVRFVQLFLSGQPWDTHSKNAATLKGLCARTDQSSAALVIDLKRRGLLDDTIVMWGGEFGRLPISQGTDGRDHNRHAFSLWFAGGGFKSGNVHGVTDEFGYSAVENRVNVHDLHATLFSLLGINHHRLTLPHEGRAASLTDAEVTHAQIVQELLD
ncbi:hypothetical protein Pla110_16060 [Polystyrenella longa]|uniref:Sulfatase n=1 Tax=Polystyrenella longa TaxID=2528007 RepID=A0A518CKZ3_9PLAN|nr:DUF1501 domain-containing protein [Polystyrenella longa]QDU79886.1 hypothetical protein Pla110_16060 [Polystyrenella longa]